MDKPVYIVLLKIWGKVGCGGDYCNLSTQEVRQENCELKTSVACSIV
jgi:hypothetical protein